jgi:(p)ppGpp synthase/HD superfamily hydrolase
MSLARLLKKIESYYPNFDRELVERAYFYAEKAHAGQFRNSGEAFIQHPLEVACILADQSCDIGVQDRPECIVETGINGRPQGLSGPQFLFQALIDNNI